MRGSEHWERQLGAVDAGRTKGQPLAVAILAQGRGPDDFGDTATSAATKKIKALAKILRGADATKARAAIAATPKFWFAVYGEGVDHEHVISAGKPIKETAQTERQGALADALRASLDPPSDRANSPLRPAQVCCHGRIRHDRAWAPVAPGDAAELAARSVLAGTTVRAGSPPSGAFFTAVDRAMAAQNGLAVPATGPVFANQPVQGFSALVPADHGSWWALADNGYGARDTSADWQLVIYKIDPGFGTTTGPQVLGSVILSDPARKVRWQTVCDPTHGAPLPPLSFNVLPATPPPACGTDPSARLLTGFDFDPESMEVARDGTFWIGDEFGPFLLHADRNGRLLDAPIAYPGVKAPQNPTLNVLGGEQPTVASSRGFEDLAISPDRKHLYAMTEGAIGHDDPQELRIVTFDIGRRHFTGEVRKLRLESPGAKVDLTALKLTDGTRAYPYARPPAGTGGESAAELTAIDGHRFLLVERDSNGDGTAAPRMKKVFLLDSSGARHREGYVDKQVLVDLMAVPDPMNVGGDGDFFRFPFNTIESVHVVTDHSIIVANDNNYPFSNGRSRSLTNERTGPLAPDQNELILIDLSTSLHPDRRLLPRG